MEDVERIVRESKNASQSIIDTIRYFGTINFLKIITSVILASDVTYFNPTQLSYFNFAHSLWLALFLSMSGAADKPSKKRPHCNLMSF
jgi:magnesium-transporting ATPase (P-type)